MTEATTPSSARFVPGVVDVLLALGFFRAQGKRFFDAQTAGLSNLGAITLVARASSPGSVVTGEPQEKAQGRP